MIKRFCDRCGKELCIDIGDPTTPLVWWTIIRHSSFSGNIAVEICDECYNTDGAFMPMNTAHTEKERASDECSN